MKNRAKFRQVFGLLLSAVILFTGLAACGPAPAVTPAGSSETEAVTRTPAETKTPAP